MGEVLPPGYPSYECNACVYDIISIRMRYAGSAWCTLHKINDFYWLGDLIGADYCDIHLCYFAGGHTTIQLYWSPGFHSGVVITDLCLQAGSDNNIDFEITLP